MNILIINQHFHPEVAATAQLVTDLAEDLTAKGLSISVITGMPGYTKEKNDRKTPIFENYKGIRIYRVPCTSFDRKSKTGRLINYLSFFLFATLRSLSISRPEIVITMSTPPFIALLGVLLKKLRGAMIVYWAQDLYPDMAISYGVIREKGIFTGLLENLSEIMYESADMIVPIGEKMAERIVKKGVGKDRVRVIHNWADAKDFKIDEDEKNPIREELGLDDKFLVLYSGNMGVAHDFETVKASMEGFKEREDMAWLFIGEGVKKKEITNYVNEKGISNTHFLPYQPREKLKYSMGAGDVMLITQDPRSAGMVVPSKIYAALAAGKPVLAVGAKDTELSEIVEKKETGLFVECGDTAGLSEAIKRLIEDEELRKTLGENGRKLFRNRFSRKRATGRFNRILKELISAE